MKIEESREVTNMPARFARDIADDRRDIVIPRCKLSASLGIGFQLRLQRPDVGDPTRTRAPVIRSTGRGREDRLYRSPSAVAA